jgi:hypothetical protein
MADPVARVEDHPDFVSSDSAPDSAPAEKEPPKRSGGRWLIVAMAALALFTIWLGWQTANLQTQNEALQGEVRHLQQQVDAYRTHLDIARERTGEVRSALEDLESHLGAEPAN